MARVSHHQSSCQGEELGPSQFPRSRVYLSTFTCFTSTERICTKFSSVLLVCVCVCVFVALLEFCDGVSASLILCKMLVSSKLLIAPVSYPQIYKVESKICSYCILILDLTRNESKHVVQKCMYRFVPVDIHK